MIGIIDYGMGNLGSVSNACRFLGLEAAIVAAPAQMNDCAAVILPGVGAFGDCMRHLERHGFIGPVKEWIENGRPFLGLCLGLQVLLDESEESPGVRGLGVFPGLVRRFNLPHEFKVPQIGWNRVQQTRRDCPLFAGIPDGSHFYFVHSYYTDMGEDSVVAGRASYGLDYPCVAWKEKVMAVQFHPEKSQDMGLRMLRNFAECAGVRV